MSSLRYLSLFSLFLIVASNFACSLQSVAQSFESKRARAEGSAATVSLIEFNPADLMWGRYRFSHENLVLESLSFAVIGEVQDSLRLSRFEEKNIALGVSLQYYPQAVSLDGLFLRGESDLVLSQVEEETLVRNERLSSNVAHLRLAADLGWRVRLSERLTGSAAYGFGKTLSHSLWSSDGDLGLRWLKQKSEIIAPRVQINLGILF